MAFTGMVINQNITKYVFNNAYVSIIPELVKKDLGANLFNLGIYVAGMVLYAVVIWFFYRNLAKKEIFWGKIEQPKQGFFKFLSGIWGFFRYLIKSLIIFPLITFIWFLILGGFLLFLSKSQDVAHILLMSMSIIAAARVTAYFNEDLAKDVAKLVPFGLLGVFIVDPGYFSMSATILKFQSIPTFIHLILQYMIAIVLLEFILRSWHKTKEYFVNRSLRNAE